MNSHLIWTYTVCESIQVYRAERVNIYLYSCFFVEQDFLFMLHTCISGKGKVSLVLDSLETRVEVVLG